jgi:hypothetical protein
MEIASDVESDPMVLMATLLAEGIKVRDFIYEPMINSCKAPKPFDPSPTGPTLIATKHMLTPSQCMHMQHDTGFSIYLDYLPGHSDEEHEAEVKVQAEAEEPKVKRQKVKAKALQRECVRPEI